MSRDCYLEFIDAMVVDRFISLETHEIGLRCNSCNALPKTRALFTEFCLILMVPDTFQQHQFGIDIIPRGNYQFVGKNMWRGFTNFCLSLAHGHTIFQLKCGKCHREYLANERTRSYGVVLWPNSQILLFLMLGYTNSRARFFLELQVEKMSI